MDNSHNCLYHLYLLLFYAFHHWRMLVFYQSSVDDFFNVDSKKKKG